MVSISIVIVNVIDEVYRYVLYSLKEEWNFFKKNKEEVVIYERNGSYLEVLETVQLGKYLMNFWVLQHHFSVSYRKQGHRRVAFGNKRRTAIRASSSSSSPCASCS